MTTIDKETLDHLKRLEAKKLEAIQREDFKMAKDLKERIIRLKNLSEQISLLESRKKKAIQKEDYDSAIALKDEIQRIRRQFEVPMDDPRVASGRQFGNDNQNQNQYQNQNQNQYQNQYQDQNQNQDMRNNFDSGMGNQNRYDGERPSNHELQTDRESRQFTRDSIPANVASERKFTPDLPE